MKIGQQDPTAQAGTTDAFHAPARMVSAKVPLPPKADVRFTDAPACTEVEPCDADKRHGIVDPFAKGGFKADELFWVWVEPDLVGPLTHKVEITLPDPKETSNSKVAELLEEPEEEDEDDCHGRGC